MMENKLRFPLDLEAASMIGHSDWKVRMGSTLNGVLPENLDLLGQEKVEWAFEGSELLEVPDIPKSSILTVNLLAV